MKRSLSFLLALALCLSLGTAAFAADYCSQTFVSQYDYMDATTVTIDKFSGSQYDAHIPVGATVTVTAGDCEETIVFEGVEGYPASYSLPDGASTMVRNWFVPKSEDINPEYLSTEDTIGEILKNDDVRGMVSGVAGKLISSPLMKLVAPIKLKTVLNLKFIHIDNDMKELAEQFLQTIKK